MYPTTMLNVAVNDREHAVEMAGRAGIPTCSSKLRQRSSPTAKPIHDVFEQVSYASHIITLRAGDVIAGGSPAGVGSARTPPIHLKPGDLSVCSYEGIGTLMNPVVGSGK
jgi:2-keto-4-pentenoate hydratase/2-oxohepta-3-ene-1,7-dioic acid hydratase in catechol pathway